MDWKTLARRVPAIFAAVAVAAGCSRGENAAVKAMQKAQSARLATQGNAVYPVETEYAALDADAVVAAAGGMRLSKGDIETAAEIRIALAKIANPKVRSDRLEAMAESTRKSAIGQFHMRAALLTEAKRRSLVLSPEMREKTRERFVASLGRRMKGKSFEAVAGRLRPMQAKSLAKELDMDALCIEVRRILKEECAAAEPTLEELAAARENIARYNKRAAKVEAAAYALATNMWQAVTAAGNDISAAESIAHDEHVNIDSEWGEFEMSFFEDEPALAKLIDETPEGGLTPPVAGFNGLTILKIEKRIVPDGQAAKRRVSLGRIFFDLPEYSSEPDDKALAEQLVEEKTQKTFEAKIKDLTASVKMEYPNGSIYFSNRASRR